MLLQTAATVTLKLKKVIKYLIIEFNGIKIFQKVMNYDFPTIVINLLLY